VSAVKKGEVAGKDADELIAESGMKPDVFHKMSSFLRENGLHEDDMLKEGAFRSVVSRGLAKTGITPEGAVRIAKGAEALVNMGFAEQQIQGAVYTLPKFADLMEHGQYDEASEYLITGGTSAVFGLLGGAGGLKSMSDLVSSLDEKTNLPMNSTGAKLIDLTGDRDGKISEVNSRFNNLSISQQRLVYEEAGLEIPENLREDGTFFDTLAGHAKHFVQNIGGDLVKNNKNLSGVKSLIQSVAGDSPENNPALSALRTKLHLHMDSGGDPSLLLAKGEALSRATGTVDQWQKFTEGIVPPERTVNTIVNEKLQEYDSLGKVVSKGQESLDSLSKQIKDAEKDRDNSKSSEDKSKASAVLVDLQKNLEEFQNLQQELEIKLEGLQKWAKDPNSALKDYHKKLYEDFHEAKGKQSPTAPENGEGTALDEFNRRTRIMGFSARDSEIIQRAHPEWFKGQEPLLSEKVGTVTSGDLRGQTAYSISNKEGVPVGKLRVEDVGNGKSEIKGSGVRVQGEGYGKQLYEETIQSEAEKGKIVVSDQNGVTSPEATHVWESLVRRGLAIKLENGTYESLPISEPIKAISPEDLEGYVGKTLTTWEKAVRHKDMPDDLENMVNKAIPMFEKLKTSDPDLYKHLSVDIPKAYAEAARGLSPKMQELVKQLRGLDDDNWATGSNNKSIHAYIENHLFRQWGKNTKVGAVLRAEAQAGRFSINVLQGRHRFYETELEGFLLGKKMLNYDPIETIRQNGISIGEAAANRKVVTALSEAPTYTQEGMPVVLHSGSGEVIPSVDGKKAITLVDPAGIVTGVIDPKNMKRLRDNGQLEPLEANRQIINRTPKVSLDNLDEFLDSIGKKISSARNKNPLLAEPLQRHIEGFNQINNFVKPISEKSANYITETLKAAQERGTTVAADPPSDFAITPYIFKLLHSGKSLRPRDVVDIEKAAENYRKLSESTSDVSPSQVAGVLRLNRAFLPKDGTGTPYLEKYLDDMHERFSARDQNKNIVRSSTDPQQGWTTRGMTQAVRMIQGAATDAEYSRLEMDKADLNRVKNEYTSTNPITQANNRPEAEKLLQDINARQPERYVYNPTLGDYLPVNHPSFRNYHWIGEGPDGTPTLLKSDMMVHKSVHAYLVNRLGLEGSSLRENKGIGKITAPLLKVGSGAKSLLLSGSPFHIIQIMARANLLGMNPFVRPNFAFDLATDPILKLGTENGLDITGSKEGMKMAEGVSSHGGVVSKIPVWGPLSSEVHSFLFDRLIPSLKVDGFKRMFGKYKETHPDWSDDAVAHHAATHVNNTFGGQNWREMGRSATTQDWFNLVALAPDWLESEMRFGASIMNGAGLGAGKYNPDEGKNIARNQVAAQAIKLYLTARVVNALYSGVALGTPDPHFETPFGLATKDKDGRTVEFGFRTLPGDILHMASDPWGFIKGRESPLVRTAQEEVTGRNQFGQKLSESDKFWDLTSNLFPIPFQSVLKNASGISTGAELNMPQQITKALGGEARVYRSPAQVKAANLAAERSEAGAMTPQLIAKHRLLMKLEDDVRAGRLTGQGLQDMADSGQLDQDSVKKVMTVVKNTSGLGSEDARLYSRVSRLNVQSALEVLHDANPSEKQFLSSMVEKKAKNYLKKARTDMTAQERMQDPTFLELRKLYPTTEESE
jgi:hypothetical protein